MEYETVIGLEVHVQLSSKSKLFCSCSTKFGAEPNGNTCPVCLGMPGVLPTLNGEVVRRAIMVGLATGCKIAPYSTFARKNYFYPDLPKGYQISQFDQPICVHGEIEINVNGASKRIGITRIHMEEDAGKLIHGDNLGNPDSSYVDLNRASVPLLEIVSEPDLRSAEETKNYVEKLKTILEYLDVSDCNMEEGSLRCDANVSIRPMGEKKLGTRSELKNMNSFRFLTRAIEYEVERQKEILESGGKVIQETRLYDPDRNVTQSMRGKEEAHDYRYFPEPDLTPIEPSIEMIGEIRAGLPELPDARKNRFVAQYGLPLYDAEVLTANRGVADYFESAAKDVKTPKLISNWVMGDILRVLNENALSAADCPVKPDSLAEMVKLIEDNVISGKIAKAVFEEMVTTGKRPKAIVEEKGLVQIADTGAIEAEVDKVIAANPSQLAEYKAGKIQLAAFFVGQVMRATKGKANPAMVNKILEERLGKA